MKTTIKSIVVVLTLLTCGNSFAQSLTSTYNTAIGLRAGETSGLTIKHFTGSNTAFEGIIGLWHHGLSATLLIEKHKSAFNVSGLNWYYGGGGHLVVQTRRSYYYYHRDRYYRYYYRGYSSGELGIGIDGIVGLEYKIPPIPFAISIDVKPMIEVTSRGSMFWGLDPSLGIKFTF
ncbi:MAG: hypothetical protein ACK4K0_02615 [Flavobacteriales bacterium]